MKIKYNDKLTDKDLHNINGYVAYLNQEKHRRAIVRDHILHPPIKEPVKRAPRPKIMKPIEITTDQEAQFDEAWKLAMADFKWHDSNQKAHEETA